MNLCGEVDGSCEIQMKLKEVIRVQSLSLAVALEILMSKKDTNVCSVFP